MFQLVWMEGYILQCRGIGFAFHYYFLPVILIQLILRLVYDSTYWKDKDNSLGLKVKIGYIIKC